MSIQFIVYFSVDSQYCILRKGEVFFHNEKDSWSFNEWREKTPNDLVLPAEALYDGILYCCTIIQIAEADADLSHTLNRIRLLRTEKKAKLQTILNTFPRIRVQRRQTVPPLNVILYYVLYF
jgi:hypothetical protein